MKRKTALLLDYRPSDGGSLSNEQDFQQKVLSLVTEQSETVRSLREDMKRLKREPSGLITRECAKQLGARLYLSLDAQDKLDSINHSRRQDSVRKAEKITGLSRSALTSSDIPLPVEYSDEVAELVDQYGAARRYGMVTPLGTGTAKLPRLKTSPAFGLIAQSGTVTEKSPQVEYVTFAARKWGGMIRIPAEMYEDSFAMLGTWLAVYSAREMAKIEDTVFFSADGTSTYDSITGLIPALIALGNVYQLSSGKTDPGDITLANMRSLRSTVGSAALNNAAYYCHRTHEQLFAGFNTSGNKPYNANGATGEPTLDGFPIRWVDVLPVYNTTAAASQGQIVFGDLRYHWLGVTPEGFRFDTSPHAAFETDEVLIRALERFDIGLMADGALGVLQLAAS